MFPRFARFPRFPRFGGGLRVALSRLGGLLNASADTMQHPKDDNRAGDGGGGPSGASDPNNRNKDMP